MKKIILFAALVFAIVAVVVVVIGLKREQPNGSAVNSTNATEKVATRLNTNPVAPAVTKPSGIARVMDLSASQKEDFAAVFTKRLKPAISNWCSIYGHHVLLTADSVTPERFIEWIGTSPRFYDYTFVIDGVTLTVADENGIAKVDYLNDPSQTRKLMGLSNGKPPIMTFSVSKADVSQMLEQDSGHRYADGDIRMIPSGVSSALNGGVNVMVGGDAENAASWDYNLIFDANGNLAYYDKK